MSNCFDLNFLEENARSFTCEPRGVGSKASEDEGAGVRGQTHSGRQVQVVVAVAVRAGGLNQSEHRSDQVQHKGHPVVHEFLPKGAVLI